MKYSIEDERLNGHKNSIIKEQSAILARNKAAEYCLKASNVKFEDIDMVVTNDIMNKVYFARYSNKVITVSHHMSHAFSTFYTSPFVEAVVLVADRCGSTLGPSGMNIPSDNETITGYYSNVYHMREIHKVSGRITEDNNICNSLGEFYRLVTEGLGFNFYEDFKVTDLSAYGTEKYVSKFYHFYSIDQKGNFVQDERQINEMSRFINKTLTFSDENENLQEKADLAYAAQFHLERIVVCLCKYLYSITNNEKLCLAGGIFLNPKLNYKIVSETPFNDIYVFPAAGGSGLALGSALYGFHYLKHNLPYKPSKLLFSPDLGLKYSREQITKELEKHSSKLEYYELDDTAMVGKIVDLLMQGKIIGWFKEGSEIGPMSLGNRVILADPRKEEIRTVINSFVKKREDFRSSACIVLDEKKNEYFSFHTSSEYMSYSFPVVESKRKVIPAVVQIDGTARVQTVTKDFNQHLYMLLKEFYSRTGVPALLSTSLNESNKPIVETPRDAVNCFLDLEIDFLVLDNYLISKKVFA
ncbi:carbamoyltransferase C-terminal domain-containing protein [Cytobacillus oceanisediminis]|uniref:carbamoyltransferase C-terminal domain-containing protein n=1 Tax=Cytobacillus oceanisediminis TaxID=665099 RepID=UPI001C23DA98|nr:carbamoyltransferase C-terminal domain-containing protein [Cytobacillus oceanisediminis]MBU8772045.1 hypothetical protein [Cytobacillus oceanisediminis]